MRHVTTLSLGALFFLVAGCGGGGGKSDPRTTSAAVGSQAPTPAPAPGPAPAPAPSTTAYDPPWANVAATRVIRLDRDAALSDAQNGDRLVTALRALVPGDRLEVGGGTWSIDRYLDLVLSGTAAAPIWIVAQQGATPVLTRPDASQNVLNLGVAGPVAYVCLRGLEVTGGSALVRLYQCSNVWLDRCHLHHNAEAALTANTANTDHLYITRNEIHHTGGTGEGMYLGGNNGAVVMRDSVIALNHVHDCGGTQGDGIEVKQGSHGNRIVENHVHDTNYPCITVYGTGGQARNVIERNVLYRSNDNVLQVQGEAIVRNNLLIAGAGSGFHSHDHQGQTLELTVVHNTIVTAGRGMNLSSWSNRANLVLANNAIFSQSGDAVTFPGGSVGVVVSGNVALGRVTGYAGPGVSAARALTDLTDVAYDASRRDARPVAGSPLVGAGDAAHAAQNDIAGAARSGAVDAGCLEAP
jgi:hypothetical protein